MSTPSKINALAPKHVAECRGLSRDRRGTVSVTQARRDATTLYESSQSSQRRTVEMREPPA
jgi:hypothetical protein